MRRRHDSDLEIERNLVARLRAGDDSAVADLAATYGQRIFQLAFRYTKSHEDAEEVAQDVLLKVYRKVDAFRGDAALSSWIYRITFNAAMSRLRSVRAERKAERWDERRAAANGRGAPDNGRPSGEPGDWSSLADEEFMRAQLRRRLAAALGDVPEIYRVPVLLRDVRGLSTEEASALLRINRQTLKSRLHRGRLILRDRLADFAGGLGLHRPAAFQSAGASLGLLPAA